MRIAFNLSILFILFTLFSFTGAADTPEGPPGQPASMTLAAQGTQELNGIYSTIIVATLKDADGQLSSGANTYFTTTLGNITTQYGYYEGLGYLNISDASGKAAALLERSSLESATVTAVTGNGLTAAITITQEQAAATSTTVVTPVPTIAPQPTATGTPAVTATATPAATSTATPAVSPAATQTAAAPVETAEETPVSTPGTQSTPGAGIVISIIMIILSAYSLRRK